MKRLALVLLTLSSATAMAEEWKLQPLKHNVPDLVVDLGVGLWAWPLPMDYDDDGDYDLVVSCPDKPSNGFYFFENPTQDPSVKMPTFKAGVHLGETGHDVQISYVDGQPRVLRRNEEFINFKADGFGEKKTIYPTSKVYRGKGRTRAEMWRYVDWEGDGDQDIVAGIGDWSEYEWDHAFDAQGRWRNGPLHGWVYLIANNGGTYADEAVKIEAGGAPVDVYGWPSPNFADFDGDGDLDLLCGEFLDGFTYFQNIGTRSEPRYAAGLRLDGADGEPLVMHLQMITPTALDWDRDGDIDLVVGDEDGRVALVENVSPENPSLPVFRQPVYFRQEADELKFGALATPFAHDWDGDGDDDILCGNTAGNIALFTNLDGSGTKWSAPELLEADGETYRIMAGSNGSIQGPAEAKWGYTTLSVADWDADGRDDILVNSIWPRLELLRNTGDGLTRGALPFWTEEAPPSFYWWQTLAENLQTQWRTTPLATDFDRDGQLDLVILDQEGYLSCQSRARAETRIFLDEDLEPIRLNPSTAGGSGRVKLAVVDWDGDGRDDILTNSQNATWWRNCRDAGDGRVVMRKVGDLARRNVAGHTSSPTVSDFDRDGKPDLLVGSENGRIYFINHNDCVSYTREQMEAREPEAVQPRFPGLVSEGFIFTKAPHKECHASTLVETSRGLVAAWFGGTKEKNPDVRIWSSYHDGRGWSGPRVWADGVQHTDLRYPCWNPVLWQEPGDGDVKIFFKVGPNPQEWWGEVMVSHDRGRSFQEPVRLPEGIDGPVRSKPILLGGGALLCPSSTEHGGDWRFHFEKLEGGEWSRFEPEDQAFQVIQPTLITHPDGRIQAFYRTKGHGVIVTNDSSDGGETWSPLVESGLPNNNSGIEALTLADGRHLLLYNHLAKGRQAIHLAASGDGRQWNAVAVIEQADQGEFSYPAMIQGGDGLIHLSYTWNRQRVRHLVLDPTKLVTGDVLTEGGWPE